MTAVMERPATLSWRRPRKDVLTTGTKRRVWESRCGGYRLEEHRHTGGRVIYLAFALTGDRLGGRPYWNELGLSRSKRVAEDRCRDHQRGDDSCFE